jgi:hypothetical protein
MLVEAAHFFNTSTTNNSIFYISGNSDDPTSEVCMATILGSQVTGYHLPVTSSQLNTGKYRYATTYSI